MYLPSSFEETRIDVLHGLMRTHALATLVTVNDTELAADHLPVQTVALPKPFGLLRGHIARANPLWRRHDASREALFVFQGPQAYISPSLYPSKQQSGEVVPTWDYVVVHAHGRLRFIHETDWLLELVSGLTDEHEAGRAAPWKVGDAPPPYVDRMLKAIVGFEFDIARLCGKWKVSQNRTAADRRGVTEGLRAGVDPQAHAIADALDGWRDPGTPVNA